jgi:hypothetical protein
VYNFIHEAFMGQVWSNGPVDEDLIPFAEGRPDDSKDKDHLEEVVAEIDILPTEYPLLVRPHLSSPDEDPSRPDEYPLNWDWDSL